MQTIVARVIQPYVEHSASAALILDISVGAFVVGEVVQALRVRSGAQRADLLAELWFRILFFAGILLLAGGRALAPDAVIGSSAWLFGTGVAIGWFGLLLRWWSSLTLGKFFTVVLKTSSDQVVVTRGPYRALRHPSYTGLLLAFVGCGLALANWVGALGSVALLLVALTYRIRIEERALVSALGDEYVGFAASRARLIPYIW